MGATHYFTCPLCGCQSGMSIEEYDRYGIRECIICRQLGERSLIRIIRRRTERMMSNA